MLWPDFGFVGQRAGFQVAESLLEVSPDDSYLQLIAAGVVNTLTVAALAIPLATAFGIAFGLLRLTRHPLLHRALTALAAPVRNTPVLLQLFVWYALLLQLPGVREAWQPLPHVFLSNRGLALPLVQSWWPVQIDVPVIAGLGLQGGWSLSPEFTALVLGLSVFHATYIADIVRGAVGSVPAGQVDAASALGLRPSSVAAHIVYPHAARVAVPPYANQCLMLIKNSTLAIAIGYQELMAVVNTTVTQTGRAVEGITLAAGFYLGISLLLASGLARTNARVNRHGIEGTGPAKLADRLGLPPLDAAGCWGTPARAATSGLVLVVLALSTGALLRWGVLDAVWTGSAQDCTPAAGACWAVVHENARLLVFGTIAAGQRGQAALACLLLVVLVAALLAPGLRSAWRAGLAVASVLATGGVLSGSGGGLTPLPPVLWGGVLVTLALAITAIAAALPCAVAPALMRRSAQRWLRWPATAVIETVRAVPLVTQLLLAAFWMPLLLGGDWSGAKFQLALMALTLHTACLLAEVLRGALQGIPHSQTVSAQALGMDRFTVLWSVLLPQARRIAAPAALGVFVGAVKDTSLVTVIGLFDVLSAAKAVLADTGWRQHYVEVYVAVALFYLLLCWPLVWLAGRRDQPPAVAQRDGAG